MKTIICDNQQKSSWDEFVRSNSADFGVLQSWAWGDFQQQLGRKVFPLATLDEQDNFVAVALVIKQPLKLGKSYFYLPRGPILSDAKSAGGKQADILESLLSQISRLAQKERAIFLRLDPAWQENEATLALMKELGLRPVGQVQPKQTLILDLQKSEAELLAQMKPKTRYNIKVAQKHGVEIIDPSLPSPSDEGREEGFKSSISDKGGEEDCQSSPSDKEKEENCQSFPLDEGKEDFFEDFWRLMEKTSQRQEIVSHPKDYYRKLISVLGGMARIVVAKYEGKVIVANIIIYAGDWCVYLHGASDYEYRDKMAPFLLQWQTILSAKKAGKRFYDFWGVDEKKWPGVTRFKQGFAPDEKFVVYAGAWDAVYSRLWYNVYRLIKSIKS